MSMESSEVLIPEGVNSEQEETNRLNSMLLVGTLFEEYLHALGITPQQLMMHLLRKRLMEEILYRRVMEGWATWRRPGRWIAPTPETHPYLCKVCNRNRFKVSDMRNMHTKVCKG